MKFQNIALLLALSINLCACSPKNTDEKPKGVLTDAQQQTLDKAKQTEDTLKKVDEERLKTLKETEGQ